MEGCFDAEVENFEENDENSEVVKEKTMKDFSFVSGEENGEWTDFQQCYFQMENAALLWML